jgi:type IV pilus assembly protein PilF
MPALLNQGHFTAFLDLNSFNNIGLGRESIPKMNIVMSTHLKLLIALGLSLLAIACAGPNKKLSEEQPQLQAEITVREAMRYLKQGNPEQALNSVLVALQLDPELPSAYNAAGLIYEKYSQPELAEKYFTRALALDPNYLAAQNNYGKFLCNQRRFIEAEKQFLGVAKVQDGQIAAAAYVNAGLCALKIPDIDRAAQYFRAARDANPRMPQLYYQLASIYYQKERYPQAHRNLQTYLKFGAHTPKSLLLGAQIERALGNTDMENNYARLLQEKFPNSEEARRIMLLNR